MKIYKLHFDDDKYDCLIPNEKPDVDEIQTFDGRSKADNWEIIDVKRMEPDKNLELSDIPGYLLPIFSEKVVNATKDLIQNEVEFLPLRYMDKIYYLINVINVIDAFDREKSDYVTFGDGVRILAVKKYSFLEESIDGSHIFKIQEEKTRSCFVTEEFKKCIENISATGFRFECVWESSRNV